MASPRSPRPAALAAGYATHPATVALDATGFFSSHTGMSGTVLALQSVHGTRYKLLADEQVMRAYPKAFHLVYVANATLLLCHEIDSARWREWELFHLPFAAAGFVLVHVPLIAVVLAGVYCAARGAAVARWFALGLGAAGLGGAGLHGFFLAKGDARFTEPASLALIFGFALTSTAQLWLTKVHWSRPAATAP